MKLTRIIAVVALAALGSCGRVTDLKPAKGEPLPTKPLMARATPTPQDLLQNPTYAKPDRVDELMKRSEPRPQDPFNLPPPTGGAAPRVPAGTDPQPVDTSTGPATPGD
jgi:hypothetical protein